MYKVYGTFISVPDLDLGTTVSLEPNTVDQFSKLPLIAPENYFVVIKICYISSWVHTVLAKLKDLVENLIIND